MPCVIFETSNVLQGNVRRRRDMLMEIHKKLAQIKLFEVAKRFTPCDASRIATFDLSPGGSTMGYLKGAGGRERNCFRHRFVGHK